ncbi:MAG: hypothetical protein IPP77_10045 [Bacteroidetes bacterium]|nr:hypothetical protein [Bacteroidota bacterium]
MRSIGKIKGGGRNFMVEGVPDNGVCAKRVIEGVAEIVTYPTEMVNGISSQAI